MNYDLLKLLDGIHRDKNIDKELLFADLESALASAAKKQFGGAEDVYVHVDRTTGNIVASRGGIPLDIKTLGRIAAQTAKQVMIQRIREDERRSIFDEFKGKEADIITGTVARAEGNILTVNLGRAEGFLPRAEQIPGETHHAGERIRCLLLEVRESGTQVKIILSRTHPDFIKRLFELEVPEVAEHIIEIKSIAREAGYRTKIAVASIDNKVDAVGACVGIRGQRIKNIVDELGGEKIDIVRWNDSSQVLIANALRPAEISEIRLCFEFTRATVVVNDDQLSLAIGRRGQNVRLAARLTGWDIDIVTPNEFNLGVQRMIDFLRSVPGLTDELISKILAMGMVSVKDLDAIAPQAFVEELSMDPELVARVQALATEEAKAIDTERSQADGAGEGGYSDDDDAAEPTGSAVREETDEDRIRAMLLGNAAPLANSAAAASETPQSTTTQSRTTPSSTTPSTGAPSTGAPSTGAPSTGAPSTGAPSTVSSAPEAVS